MPRPPRFTARGGALVQQLSVLMRGGVTHGWSPDLLLEPLREMGDADLDLLSHGAVPLAQLAQLEVGRRNGVLEGYWLTRYASDGALCFRAVPTKRGARRAAEQLAGR